MGPSRGGSKGEFSQNVSSRLCGTMSEKSARRREEEDERSEENEHCSHSTVLQKEHPYKRVLLRLDCSIHLTNSIWNWREDLD